MRPYCRAMRRFLDCHGNNYKLSLEEVRPFKVEWFDGFEWHSVMRTELYGVFSPFLFFFFPPGYQI
jgi:hypothetical protein